MWVFLQYQVVKSYQKETIVIEKREERNEDFEKPIIN
jgi:hypothetical protein